MKVFFGGLLLSVSACSSMSDTPKNLGVQANGGLLVCPDKPNCISSSDKDPEKRIEPFKVIQPDKVWQHLKASAEKVGTVSWVATSETYYYGVFETSIMRFPDDVEFLLDTSKNIIELRSASRFGYSDLGKNRSRLEDIRIEFKALQAK
ncbi:MAG: DUF1499 domain-containing protein [Pseudobacteriovorax sp.]|nr:DUF1499 domain-containing protein [Pseudobacteriovorax sp.]